MISEFRSYIAKMKHYEEALNVLYWDLRTGAPRNSVEARSEVIGTLSEQLFELQTSSELGELLGLLESRTDELAEVDRVLVRETRREYDQRVKIPANLHKQYVMLTTQAESAWEVAKAANDWASFAPMLGRIIELNKQMIDLWGVREGCTPYDTLLDMYEPGVTVRELDALFGQLRDRIVPLLERLRSAGKAPDRAFLAGQTFDVAAQKTFSRYMLGQLGFDFGGGRLDESVHPFMTGLNTGDIRLTTRYLEDDVTSALFGTIHECGHGLYEQNVAPELGQTTLAVGTSMGIHESQSRFWENVIGRSRPFWRRYLRELQLAFPGQLEVDAETFYRAINTVEPSLIRIEADELTYSLHIMIRYELEKRIFNEGLAIDDLPAAWNQLYSEALGVTPSTDAEGVLQDVHWSGGAFGYFPSYSLGNMYAAQFTDAMERAIPDMWEQVERGEFATILGWLRNHIYKYGKLRTPRELIVGVTGKELDATYFVEYLEKKYSEIYRIV